MPPKKNNQKRKAKRAVPKRAKTVQNNEIAKLTQMVANLNKPSNQVTDLGRMLLHGGNMLGGLVGLPTIFGSGEYKMSQNSLWSAGGQIPYIHSESETITLRHREFIDTVSMSGAAFTQVVTLDVNPGDIITFPFLSTIARNFQEYSFKGLVFEYKSTSSVALTTGTNTAMGVVAMAAQYRTDMPAAVTLRQMLNTMWSVDSKPSENALLPIECDPKENPFNVQYVRDGISPGDPKMYDLCQVQVATFGGQTGQTNVIGELWVSYEVELRKPIVVSELNGLYQAYTSTWTNAAPISGLTTPVNTLGVTTANNSFFFPAGMVGTFVLIVNWNGNNNGVLGAYPTLGNNNLTPGTSRNSPLVGAAASVATMAYYQIFTVTDKTQVSEYIINGDGVLPTSGAPINGFTHYNIVRLSDRVNFSSF